MIFTGKILCYKRKYNKKIIKNIKKQIAEAILGNWKFLSYPTDRLNDNIINYFKKCGMQVEKIDIYETKSMW